MNYYTGNILMFKNLTSKFFIYICFILLCFIINSCSVISSMSSEALYQKTAAELIIENKSKEYPNFNIDFGSFLVVNAPLQDDIVATEEILNAYHKLTVKEKTYMLRNLDVIKFAINTPEFEAELHTRRYRSSRKGSGPNGTIVFGSYYDTERLFQLIKNRKYTLSIHKDRITKNAQAVGMLGEFLYVMADNDPRMTNSYWIAMPNHEIWDRGLYAEENFIAPIVFHEMMHNTGFSHGIDENDTVYQLQDVLSTVLRNRDFKNKYASELEKFRPFYEERYKGWLKNDTLSYKKSLLSTVNNLDNDNTFNNIYHDSVYCVINNDNTHIMYTNGVK